MTVAPPDSRPFVGRISERGLLAGHLAAVRDGGGRVVLVSGEAGVGKTRLVEEALAELPRGRVLWGRCHDIEGTPAFWPWSEALRRHVDGVPLARLRRELRGGGARVARLVPAVLDRLPDAAPREREGPEPEAQRFRLFDGVRDFLLAMAGREPHAIVLDDLHWADLESLLLLRFLAPELRGSKLLVVATYREREMRQTAAASGLLGDLVRTSHHVPLDGLGASDVADYLRARAGADPRGEMVTAIHAATAGNAFFLTEVVDLLERDGRLAATDAEVRIDVPDTVRDAIRRRLEPLPEASRQVLAAGAVLGQEFAVDVLAAVVGRSAENVLGDLAPATVLGAVAPRASRPGAYGFAHALLRDTLIDSLDAATRAQLHRGAAEALERVHAAAPDAVLGEIAHHYFRAAPLGTLAQAIAHSTRAGQYAYAQLGFEAAAGHFARALAASTAAMDPTARLQLLMQLGQAQSAAGDDDAARAAYGEAAAVARDQGDDVMLAIAAALAAGAGAEVGTSPTVDEAEIGLLEEALDRAGPRDSHRRVFLLGMLSRLFHFADVERRHRDSAEALAVARRLGDPEMIASGLQARHGALLEPGRTAERRLLSEECASLLTETTWPLQLGTHIGWQVYDRLEAGEIDAVHEALARYRILATRHRLPRLRWHVTLIESALALSSGRLDEAERLSQRAVAVWAPSARNNVANYHAVQRFLLWQERGGAAAVLPVRATAERPAARPVWRAGLALTWASLGYRKQAVTVMTVIAAQDFADLPCDANLLATWALLAETCALLDAPQWAELLLPRVAPHADSVVVVGPTVGCLGSAARYAGLLAHTVGRLDEAVGFFENALETNHRLGAVPQYAHTQRDLARTLSARGRASDAGGIGSLRAEAAATAARLGLVVLGERLAADAGAGQGAQPPTPRIAPRSLGGTATIRRKGEGWAIAWSDESTQLRNTKGVAYLVELIRHPGREVHAGHLGGHDVAGDAGEMLDAEARRAYKARLDDLREELAEASEFNDLGRATRLREEIEILTAELGRAAGLGGRARRVASGVERARLNVTRAIRSVIRKVEADCPLLGRHLERSVQTGIFCAYEPDPTTAIDWSLP